MRWIFGYGSLVWRPAFDFERRVPARLDGWQRRFWQGSTDHRGVPGRPGRVVTLLERPDAHVVGMAFGVAAARWEQVVEALDLREIGGYSRHEVSLEPLDGSAPIEALVYVAGPNNSRFLGEAAPEVIAAQIDTAAGPSGPNDQYLLELEAWLTQVGHHDAHVQAIADALRARRS